MVPHFVIGVLSRGTSLLLALRTRVLLFVTRIVVRVSTSSRIITVAVPFTSRPFANANFINRSSSRYVVSLSSRRIIHAQGYKHPPCRSLPL
jgi:hypothetical protein